jgi:hypothetical protein
VRLFLVLAASFLLFVPVSRADMAEDTPPPGDMDLHVTVDPKEQTVHANATLRIHASREMVWSVLTNCTQALELVPGIVSCEVLETAPDKSWQRIHQVVDYSWMVPRLSYEIRATYDYPTVIKLERVAGDLRKLDCSWTLEADGEFTNARYSLDLAPGFWVPHWVMRLALKHDLPKMLRTLRTRAESAFEKG